MRFLPLLTCLIALSACSAPPRLQFPTGKNRVPFPASAAQPAAGQLPHPPTDLSSAVPALGHESTVNP